MDSRNDVTVLDSNKESEVLTPQRSYIFLDGNPYYNIRKIPEFLAYKADILRTAIGRPEMEIYKKKEPAFLSIRSSFIKRKNNVLKCHFLYWHLTDFDNYNSFDFVKDSALSADCTYKIDATTDYSGW